jgi:penicillin amidase
MKSRTNTVRRWFKYLLSAFFLFLLAALVGAAVFLRASLPQLDGDIRELGLGDAMTVDRDAAGVPTIKAGDQFDLSYGLGYLHAQDRFFQMDYLRRTGAGELSELFGPAGLELDREHRLYQFRAQAEALLARLPADDRRRLQRYAKGVNDGLRGLSARSFEYAVLGMQPAEWQPEDSLLVIWAMYFQLQGTLPARQIARTWLRQQATSQQLALLLPSASEFDAPLDAASIAAPAVPLPAAAPAWFSAAGTGASKSASLDYRSSVGSSNWAIAGNRSTRGGAIVGNDMHLMLGLPNTWYRAVFDYPGKGGGNWRVAGVTLPGLPAMVAGSNGHVAWGFTVAYADCFELVPLERDSADARRFKLDGAWQLAAADVETIKVKGAPAVALTVLKTAHGPVREIDGKFYAMHWVAQSEGGVNLGIVRIAEASDIAGAMAAASQAGIPAENMVVGDRAGHIGWTIAGALPDRRAGLASDDPGRHDGGAGWQALLAPADYPRVVDPSGGQLWTANNRQLAGDAYRLIGDGGADIGARASQVRDDLSALGMTDERAAYQINLDDRALFMERWRGQALRVLDGAALAGRPERAEFRRLLMDSWSGHASVDSVGYTLARGYLHQLYDVIFDGVNARLKQLDSGADYELANPRWPALVSRLLDEQPAAWLPAAARSWNEVQLMAVDRTIASLKAKGVALDQARWGDRNTLKIAHPFAASIPVLGRWLAVAPEPVPGDSHMPRVAGPDFGQSERMVVSPGAEEHGVFNMPGGQSGHPLSRFFLAGHEAWVKGESMPFLPGATRYSLKFSP